MVSNPRCCLDKQMRGAVSVNTGEVRLRLQEAPGCDQPEVQTGSERLDELQLSGQEHAANP